MAEARVAASQRRSKGKAPSYSMDTETSISRSRTHSRNSSGYAVSQGMTMVELLKDGFELSRRKPNSVMLSFGRTLGGSCAKDQ